MINLKSEPQFLNPASTVNIQYNSEKVTEPLQLSLFYIKIALKNSKQLSLCLRNGCRDITSTLIKLSRQFN